MITAPRRNRLFVALLALALILPPTPAAADDPTPTPVPNVTLTDAPKRLVPRSGETLSIDRALELLYGDASLLGFTFAWDDVHVEYYRQPTRTHDGAREEIQREIEYSGGQTAPRVQWMIGVGETDELMGMTASTLKTVTGASTRPPSLHKFLNESRTKRSARPASSPRITPSGSGTNWEPNWAQVDASRAGGNWTVTTELHWDDWQRGNSPKNLAKSYGFETTVWTRNDGISGKRETGNCVGGDEYNDYTGSFNGNLGGVTSPELVRFESLGGDYAASVGFYVDWWSYDDNCSHKNWDYGIALPSMMQPHLDMGWGVRVTLRTALGTQPSGVAQAHLQSVYSEKCLLLNMGYSTLCMDLPPLPTNPNVPTTMPIFGEQRNAFLPGTLNYSMTNGVQILGSQNGSPKGTTFGDSSSDGNADILYIRPPEGDTSAYFGYSTSALSWAGNRGAPFQGSNFPAGIARVPDMNADSYADYAYIAPEMNQLCFMIGGPVGTIFRPLQTWGERAWLPYCIGNGWNGVRSVTPGKWGGGLDFYAIGANGDLNWYALNTGTGTNGAFSPSASLVGKRGSGWDGITQMIRLDWDSDGDWDILATNTAGQLYLYSVGPNGAVSQTRQIGQGWGSPVNGNLVKMSNSGDLTGDGKNDILGHTPDGRLLVYPVRNSSIGTPREIGHGFAYSAFVV